MADDLTSELLSQAVALDPSLRSRAVQLAEKALARAEHLMEYGTPQMQAMIVGKFLTATTQAMKAKEQNEELEQLKEQMGLLITAVNGHSPGADEKIEVEEVERDEPKH